MKFLHDANQLTTEPERVAARQDGVAAFGERGVQDFSHVFEHGFADDELSAIGQKNCQNLIGSVRVPLGVAGSVPVKVMERKPDLQSHLTKVIDTKEVFDGQVLIPLATTEGALIASVQRGCKAITTAGQATVIVEQKGMTRAPVFRCKDGAAAHSFLDWILTQQKVFQDSAKEVSNHLQFMQLQGWVDGRLVFLRCSYDPSEAMGMNMVTFAVQSTWDKLSQHPAVQKAEVELIAISGNMCSDKKQAAVNTLLGRGWWVQAEVELPNEVVEKILRTDVQQLIDVHVAKNEHGSVLAGHAAANMHIANIAAAFLIATGQDPAHVVDVSQGRTTFERTKNGLYAAVTLPTVPLGSVGGGTWLPTQSEAIKLVKSEARPTAAQLAGTLGVAVLAGELSGLAALATHHLACAHRSLGRVQP